MCIEAGNHARSAFKEGEKHWDLYYGCLPNVILLRSSFLIEISILLVRLIVVTVILLQVDIDVAFVLACKLVFGLFIFSFFKHFHLVSFFLRVRLLYFNLGLFPVLDKKTCVRNVARPRTVTFSV